MLLRNERKHRHKWNLHSLNHYLRLWLNVTKCFNEEGVSRLQSAIRPSLKKLNIDWRFWQLSQTLLNICDTFPSDFLDSFSKQVLFNLPNTSRTVLAIKQRNWTIKRLIAVSQPADYCLLHVAGFIDRTIKRSNDPAKPPPSYPRA